MGVKWRSTKESFCRIFWLSVRAVDFSWGCWYKHPKEEILLKFFQKFYWKIHQEFTRKSPKNFLGFSLEVLPETLSWVSSQVHTGVDTWVFLKVPSGFRARFFFRLHRKFLRPSEAWPEVPSNISLGIPTKILSGISPEVPAGILSAWVLDFLLGFLQFLLELLQQFFLGLAQNSSRSILCVSSSNSLCDTSRNSFNNALWNSSRQTFHKSFHPGFIR